MKLGYVRTSGDEPTEAQRATLQDAGVRMIFEDCDVPAGAVFKPNYAMMLHHAKAGDVIVVTRLDRLANRPGPLLDELLEMERLGLSFESVEDGIVTEPGGSFYRQARALVAFMDGVAARSSARNPATPGHRKGGQPPVISEQRWQELQALLEQPTSLPVSEVARIAGVSRQAIYKRLSNRKDKDACNDRD